ncbi:MAG TPA: protein-L-isoaspartate O-methyltransferase [Gammaproteobacteria bacterium]|nr:protein-L-isoaspartate O-methyltransferase [Gammaproteobacteria bacterium]
MTTTAVAKFNMIEQQIRPWEVLDHQVLSVLDEIDREDFVREPYKGLAYADCQIPVAAGVRMLPPTVEGRMLQALAIVPGDRVLEVGSCSGYLAACLAKLGGRVSSIDTRNEVIEFAAANLAACGMEGVDFEQRSLLQVEAEPAYDAIAVTASLAEVPDNLRRALKTGGRLFVIVGQSPVMEALLVTRVDESEWTSLSLFETDLLRLQL